MQPAIGSLVLRQLLGSALTSGLSAPGGGINTRALLEARGLLAPGMRPSREAWPSNVGERPEAAQPDAATTMPTMPDVGAARTPGGDTVDANDGRAHPDAWASTAGPSVVGGTANDVPDGWVDLGANRELPAERLAWLSGGQRGGLHNGRTAMPGSAFTANAAIGGYSRGLAANGGLASVLAGMDPQGSLAGARSSITAAASARELVGSPADELAALLGGGGAATLDLVDANIRLQIQQLRQAQARHQELLEQSLLNNGRASDSFLGGGIPNLSLLASAAGGVPRVAPTP